MSASTDSRAELIRALRARGLTRPKIARELGVSNSTVDAVLYNKRTRQTYERKSIGMRAEEFADRNCLRCGVAFKSPLQKGRALYRLCGPHRGAAE